MLENKSFDLLIRTMLNFVHKLFWVKDVSPWFTHLICVFHCTNIILYFWVPYCSGLLLKAKLYPCQSLRTAYTIPNAFKQSFIALLSINTFISALKAMLFLWWSGIPCSVVLIIKSPKFAAHNKRAFVVEPLLLLLLPYHNGKKYWCYQVSWIHVCNRPIIEFYSSFALYKTWFAISL